MGKWAGLPEGGGRREEGADRTGLQCPALLGRREEEGGEARGSEQRNGRQDATRGGTWEGGRAGGLSCCCVWIHIKAVINVCVEEFRKSRNLCASSHGLKIDPESMTAPSELVPSWTGGPGASSSYCSTAVVDQ
ncbi:hypothetical protein D4764_01G0019120 [Takifugu flavidus]|uniref:Uncharacterized protein n=1 Tax=Takifugu flavidus TaxID=433684 RepID=A0A5C6PU29_9TELE|nr:hypothetical protein D4764_01G0019120 [Takifugu flavidus]